tara:strand:- start:35970 stop:36233 length:264 start_codon:yes stop_codon:yes gene_type:complete
MKYSYLFGILSSFPETSILAWVFITILVLIIVGAMVALIEFKANDASKKVFFLASYSIGFLLTFGIMGFVIVTLEYLIIRSFISDYT